MDRSLRRLAFALASSDLAPAELRQALAEIEREGPDRTVGIVKELRRAMLQYLNTLDTPGSEVSESLTQVTQDSQAKIRQRENLAEKIRIDLQQNAGFSSERAMRLLVGSILKERPVYQRRLPKFRPKEGLRSWLVRLLCVVPPSTVLHHVAKLRKQHTQGDTVDWPLRDRS